MSFGVFFSISVIFSLFLFNILSFLCHCQIGPPIGTGQHRAAHRNRRRIRPEGHGNQEEGRFHHFFFVIVDQVFGKRLRVFGGLEPEVDESAHYSRHSRDGRRRRDSHPRTGLHQNRCAALSGFIVFCLLFCHLENLIFCFSTNHRKT